MSSKAVSGRAGGRVATRFAWIRLFFTVVREEGLLRQSSLYYSEFTDLKDTLRSHFIELLRHLKG
ncbi:MAG TPA: hypothetical protein DEB39_12025 [Planctomycetaceae bacterium]|nr:hypothetical protein [Planctomycetaceae bacterium]